MSLQEVQRLIRELPAEELKTVLETLRRDNRLPRHPIEEAWNTSAETILQAIYDAPDLTQRGVRGVLAEATFRTVIVAEKLKGWLSHPLFKDHAYDLLLTRDGKSVRVQVKNQRKAAGAAKIDAKLTREAGFDIYIVETQRTRNGHGLRADGIEGATRPYRFGEFDVLAVCLFASTGSWTDFIYCPANRLLPRRNDSTLLAIMQPIFIDSSRGWTSDFDDAARQALS